MNQTRFRNQQSLQIYLVYTTNRKFPRLLVEDFFVAETGLRQTVLYSRADAVCNAHIIAATTRITQAIGSRTLRINICNLDGKRAKNFHLK